jgi:hypothetical protein
MRLHISILSAMLFLVSCAPKHNARGDYSLRTDNRALLEDQLNDSLLQLTEGRKVKRSNRVIKTKKEALELATTVFLKEYGEDDNVEERIFTIHLLNGFWIVRGLLPHGFNGGTLVAIIDSQSGELLSTLVWR